MIMTMKPDEKQAQTHKHNYINMNLGWNGEPTSKWKLATKTQTCLYSYDFV